MRRLNRPLFNTFASLIGVGVFGWLQGSSVLALDSFSGFQVAQMDAKPLPVDTKPVAQTDFNEPFVYVVDQDLRGFLMDFARRTGMRADIAPSIKGRLVKIRLPVDTLALLGQLSNRYDIEWFIEGDLLRISSRSDLTTRIINLQSIDFNTLLTELKSADVDVNKYPIKRLKDSDAVIVTAPLSYVAKVTAIIELLKNGSASGIKVVRFGIESK